MKPAFHGGAFYEAIGVDFANLDSAGQVINADVLDAWFDPSPRVIDALRRHLPLMLRTSPPAYSDGLIAAISEVRGVPAANIVAGGGSSDLIFSLFPQIVGKDERVLILDPMYGEYQHILENVLGAHVIRHRLLKEQQFCVDSTALLADIRRARPRLVALVNPNSPTGRYLPREQLRALLEQIPQDTPVVVDETYIEYIGAHASMERDVLRFPNLVIIKSMSKVYALSGLRVGYLVAQQRTIEKLARVIPPWAVSFAGQLAGIQALDDATYYQQKYQATHQLRDELTQSLSRIPWLHVYPSTTNFVLVELLEQHMSAQEIVQRLKAERIYLRNADSMSVHFGDKFLRIAVKARDQQQRIVAGLAGCADREAVI
ncbi:MAG TPA: histidinol-phosphate transaminase [Herpetosiphonaceae bacterium]